MIVALILATGGGCWFTCVFLCALNRELQLANFLLESEGVPPSQYGHNHGGHGEANQAISDPFTI